MTEKTNPIRDTDAEAIRMAKTLMCEARHGALAVTDPETAAPSVSRVQISTDCDGALVTLVSSLSPHTSALLTNPKGALLLGEVGKGDPLVHPRITVFIKAQPVVRESEDHARLRRRHLARHPKASLYADFGDFSFFRLIITGANLNGGFGKAYALTAHDLAMAGDVAGIKAMEANAVDHMNDDHADAIQHYVSHFANADGKSWRLATLDPEGMTLVDGDRTCRIFYPKALDKADDLRPMLVMMAKQARSNTGEQIP